MILPIFKDDNRNLMMLQTKWATQLNPLLANPSLQNIILKNVSLTTGSNIINHKLGRKLQGYRVIRQRSAATIYDNQDSNPTPDLTLILISDATVSVDLEVL